MTVDDYAARAESYALETRDVAVPVLLPPLLKSASAVAEVPSGVGHFLDEYHKARSRVTLLDAEPRMLDIARERASAKLVDFRVMPLTLGTDSPTETFDLIVCPNAAFNYLASILGASKTAVSLAGLLAPEGRLLVQALVQWPDGDTDSCGCYAPDAPEETWFTEWTRTDERIRSLTRRRWQRRAGDAIEVRMERHADGRSIGTSRITMLLPSLTDITAAVAAAGLHVEQVVRGRRRPSEIVFYHNETVRRR
jgi:SAM-dependent methyltransferase